MMVLIQNRMMHVKGKLLRVIGEELHKVGSGQYFVTLNKSELLEEDLKFLNKIDVL